MDKQLIERLAREAGGRLEQWMSNPPRPACWWVPPEALERLAALVADECAKIADEHEEGPSAGPAIRAKFLPSIHAIRWQPPLDEQK